MPRPLTLPRPVPIAPIFDDAAILAALAAARVAVKMPGEDLPLVAWQLNADFAGFLAAGRSHSGQLGRLHAALLRIADGDFAGIARWGGAARLASSEGLAGSQWLDDPVAVNLMTAVAACRQSAALLEGCEVRHPESAALVRKAAQMAAASIAAGIARDQAERQAESRRRAMIFSWRVIDAYVALCGGKVGFSRDAMTNQPTGPLLRFLASIYCHARRSALSIANAAAVSALLAPADETLVDHILAHRQSAGSA